MTSLAVKARWKQWALAVVALAFIAQQGTVIYHRVFNQWQGPVGTLGRETFLPAVMIAAGRGFRVPESRSMPELNAFMNYETTRLDKACIPADAILAEPDAQYQWHRYMLYTVGILWRLFGISWNVVALLTLAMLFVSCLAVYGICRVFLPASWSLYVVLAFTWNQSVLFTMPLFRDFSKAPFILMALWLLAGVLFKRSHWKRYLGAALSIGLILGTGMGFRRDMAALVPLSCFVLFIGPLYPVRYNRLLRCTGPLILAGAFLVVGGPILTALYPMRWINAHDMHMGFSSRCEQQLGTLLPASYEKLYISHDVFASWQVEAAALHGISMDRETRSQMESVGEETALTQNLYAYLWTLARTFPGDLVTRAYAAVLRCCVGFGPSFPVPLSGFFESCGLLFVSAALLITAAWHRRQATRALLILCLFCGYTSLQFGTRHAFHLSFIPYLAGCFVLYHAGSRFLQAWRNRNGRPDAKKWKCAFGHSILWGTAVLLALWLPMAAARKVQAIEVERIEQAYRNAERKTVQYKIHRGWQEGTLLTPLDTFSCRPCQEDNRQPYFRQRVLVAKFRNIKTSPDLKLIYESNNGGWSFSGPVWSYMNPPPSRGNVEVAFTVYETVSCREWNRFAGILLPEEQEKYFVGFDEIQNLNSIPFFLNITLPENRDAFESFQRLRLPWPHTPPLFYPWPMESCLSQGDEGIISLMAAGDWQAAASAAREGAAARPGTMHMPLLQAQALISSGQEENGWDILHGLLHEFPDEYALYHGIDAILDSWAGQEGRQAGWKHITDLLPEDSCAREYLEIRSAPQ